MTTRTHPTRFGELHLAATGTGLAWCGVTAPPDDLPDAGGTGDPDATLAAAGRELDAYLAGELREFTVPVDLGPRPESDRRILTELRRVGHGVTTTYGALARSCGLDPSAARRVGGVMARNPVMIIVPCHRVVGADGSLTGFAGGLDLKRALLDLESADHTLW